MLVDKTDLGGGDSCVLELHGRSLFATKDNDILALYAHRASTYVHPELDTCRPPTELGYVWSR